ncbi:hypothetical protein MJM45_30085, partial [Salmonella enterica subsp. enterica serovar Kentucky]|nr:hypothetical protein [Salmonella enterica subsp. enterica serovar Kentucky]
VKNELSQYGILPEEWGGESQFVHVSAKAGTGIDELLDAILLQVAAQYHQAMADLPFQPLSLPAWEHIHAWHLFIIRVDEARCGIT